MAAPPGGGGGTHLAAVGGRLEAAAVELRLQRALLVGRHGRPAVGDERLLLGAADGEAQARDEELEEEEDEEDDHVLHRHGNNSEKKRTNRMSIMYCSVTESYD